MPPAEMGFGMALLRMTLALALVCALAALVLWLLRRRQGAAPLGLRVVARLALEPRRTLYVIDAAGRYLLIGVGDGPMSVLAELDAAQVGVLEAHPGEGTVLQALERRS